PQAARVPACTRRGRSLHHQKSTVITDIVYAVALRRGWEDDPDEATTTTDRAVTARHRSCCPRADRRGRAGRVLHAQARGTPRYRSDDALPTGRGPGGPVRRGRGGEAPWGAGRRPAVGRRPARPPGGVWQCVGTRPEEGAAGPDLLDAYGSALHDALLRHPNALPLYGTRPVRSQEATEWGVRMLLKMADQGVPSPSALQVALCVNEYVIGHTMARSADLTASHRSRAPEPGSAGFNVLAAAVAEVQPDAHFRLGLRALIDGLQRAVSPHGG